MTRIAQSVPTPAPARTAARSASRRRGLVIHKSLGLVLAVLASAGMPPSASAQVPGVESFVPPPTTPAQLWETIDYLIRTDQPNQAVPFLKKLAASNPDDDSLVGIRDRFGLMSIFRLGDNAATRPFSAPLIKKIVDASRRVATRPERIAAGIAGLSQSPGERKLAIERLREGGPYSVPPILRTLVATPDPKGRSAIIAGIAGLDSSTLPPLFAALDSTDAETVAAVAEALGAMGDARAIPYLTILATRPAGPVQAAARQAIRRITGTPFESQVKSAVNVLIDEARSAHREVRDALVDPATDWVWDEASQSPVTRISSPANIRSDAGLKFARAAAGLAPDDPSAKVALLNLALERHPADAEKATRGVSPAVLGEVVRKAIAERRYALAATAVTALGSASDSKSLYEGPKAGPLVEALNAPDRRVQIAAAQAIIGLKPDRAFPGSSRVVPTLARFVTAGSVPRALVIDGNPNRGSQVVHFLNALGYDAQLAQTGELGFRLAAETADVELIAIDPHFVQGSWRLLDTLANLRADAKTAGIPIFIVGPLSIQDKLASKVENFGDVNFLVSPTEAVLFKQQVDRGLANVKARPLSEAERIATAKQAAGLLAEIASKPTGPFHSDLSAAGHALSIALNSAPTAVLAAKVLGDLPQAEAQRRLAEIVLDPVRASDVRVGAAQGLAQSLKRFGIHITVDQAARLVIDGRNDRDDAVRVALKPVVDSLAVPKKAQAKPASVPVDDRSATPRPAST